MTYTFPPIPQLVEQLLQEALEKRASDLHLESSRQGLRLRHRIDGQLQEAKELPSTVREPILNRLKILATGVNIAEQRLPQDGRFSFQYGKKNIDVRLATLPTLHGESIVLRFLDPSMIGRSLTQLNLLSDQEERMRAFLKKADGLLLVTGPTGSGKTTTLYACLQELHTPQRKIITLEDPIEYHLPMINQVTMDRDRGLDFAKALRATLRHGINTLMIGEIRDRVTAEIAFEASLTGHFILSSLHANSTLEVPLRLQELGITPYFLSQGLVGIVGQRLIRKLCPDCKREIPLPAQVKKIFPPDILLPTHIMEPKGCCRCHYTGFAQRQPLLEILPMSSWVQMALQKKEPLAKMAQQLRAEGFQSLRESGLKLLLEGTTSLSEVLSTTPNPISPYLSLISS